MFYVYVRSKQNVRDEVGPKGESAGNIIITGLLMSEDLNDIPVQCLPDRILMHY